MVGELSDGVIALAIGPIGLLGGEAFDGDVRGDEPVFLGVRGLELVEQDAPERWRLLVVFLVLREGDEWQTEQNDGGERVYTGSPSAGMLSAWPPQHI